MSERCPQCGAEYNGDTSEFIPVKAEDGTYEPTKDWIHHPRACVDFMGNQLARAKERIADLERERNKLLQGIRKLLETIDNELGEGAHWISEQAPYQPCAVCGETEAWCGCEEAEGDQQR